MDWVGRGHPPIAIGPIQQILHKTSFPVELPRVNDIKFVMYKKTTFIISQNLWSKVVTRNFDSISKQCMADVTNRIAQHCSCSYEK